MTDYVPYLGDVLAGVASSDSAESRQTWDRLLQTGAQAGWDQARTQLQDQLKAALGRGDMIAQGVSLYDIDLRLAPDVSLARRAGASSTEGGIPMQLRLGPDLIQATSTTPTAFGKEFDPRFSVDFAVVVDFSLVVQPARMSIGLEIGSAHVTGKDFSGNPQFDSQNLIADIVKFVAEALSPWFGGPNYVAMVESFVGQNDFAGVLNQALQPVNDKLGELAKQGMGSVVALFPDAVPPSGLSPKALSLGGPATHEAQLLVLAQPVLGDGVVSGAIHWPRSAGTPALDPPFAGAFAVTATVDRGAASGAFSQQTNVTHPGGMEYAPTDSEHVLRYTLSGLPTDEPIVIACVANADVPWNGDAASKIRSPERDGWNGRVTVHPGVRVAEKFRGGAAGRAGEEVELNPQPIPPGRPVRLGEQFRQEVRPVNPAELVELNPQPIPPGRAGPPEERLVQGRQSPALGFQRETVTPSEEQSRVKVSEVFVRDDPSGSGAVDGINFVVHFLDQPH